MAEEKAWHPWDGQYRLARCFAKGMDELNRLFPDRPQGAQEGTVGDLAHRAEGSGSDHNPNAAGVVRAWDIQVDGAPFDGQKLADHLAKMMHDGVPMFGSVGYVIFSRKITPWTPWALPWQPYTGSDQHIQHIHLSVGANPSEYDWSGDWNLAAAFGESTSSGSAQPIHEEEEDMGVILFCKSRGYRYVNGGKSIPVYSQGTLANLKAAGVKQVLLAEIDYDNAVKFFK